MLRKLFVLASLVLVLQAPEVLSRPPDGPSGRLVQDPVPALQDEVKRLEKAAGSEQGHDEDLAEARARLAAAEGRIGEARAAWRKIIAAREEQMKRWQLLELKGKFCNPIDPAILHGPVAEARCGLAEVENNRVVLARDLPMVIAYHEARLKIIDTLRKTGAYEPEETEEERAMRKELRQLQKRLDAVKRK